MFTRRTILKTGLGAGSSLALGPLVLAGRPRSDELRVAVAGVRGRGRNHVDGFRSIEGVRVVAVCDVDQAVLDGERARLAKAGLEVDGEREFRRLLEREDVDAVSIATPNHWHALQAVWACQAGKHVYLEKPVSHNVWEGRQIVKAARKHGRIVQTGTQCRSSQALTEAIAWVRAGNLGAIRVARGLCYKPRQSIGKVDGPQAVPESVDYELWCGPAPKTPLMRAQLHYDWHWDSATGNGDLGNQGVHQVDLCRWALGEAGPAPRVLSIGGRLGYDDDGDTPNTQIMLHDYERAPLVFEVRGLPRDAAAQATDWGGGMDRYRDTRIGVIVECEEGWLRIPSYSTAQAYGADGELLQEWKGAEDHYANFVDAVRSGRAGDLRADIEEGHQSSALCHYATISHRLGGAASPEEVRRALEGREVAAESFERMAAHLVANGVDLARTPLTLGRALSVDPALETIAGDEEAVALLSRAHRAPFEFPAI